MHDGNPVEDDEDCTARWLRHGRKVVRRFVITVSLKVPDIAMNAITISDPSRKWDAVFNRQDVNVAVEDARKYLAFAHVLPVLHAEQGADRVRREEPQPFFRCGHSCGTNVGIVCAMRLDSAACAD